MNGNQSSLLDVETIFPSKLSDYLKSRLESEYLPEIAKQFLPNIQELSDDDGVGAFFSDEKEIANRVFQKYPNRCIIYATSNCFANCRYCSRKEKWRDKFSYSKFDFDAAIDSIRIMPEIEEVLLMGGDLFTLTVEEIDYMIQSVSNIPHVKLIRLATRSFVTNPYVISDELCKALSKYNNIIICTQFNHPSEFSHEAAMSLQKIQKTGAPILNQSVLLKGVNDSVPVLRKLFTICAEHRLIPYYFFHCFKVKGTQYFRTKPLLGQELISALIGQIGGWLIPRYVLIPHTTGVKIPVCPNGIVENSGTKLILQDFRGRKILYD